MSKSVPRIVPQEAWIAEALRDMGLELLSDRERKRFGPALVRYKPRKARTFRSILPVNAAEIFAGMGGLIFGLGIGLVPFFFMTGSARADTLRQVETSECIGSVWRALGVACEKRIITVSDDDDTSFAGDSAPSGYVSPDAMFPVYGPKPGHHAQFDFRLPAPPPPPPAPTIVMPLDGGSPTIIVPIR